MLSRKASIFAVVFLASVALDQLTKVWIRGHVAEGWGAGLSARYRGPAGDAFALRLDWQTEADAQEWADALPAYVKAAFGVEGSPCDAGTCWSSADRQVAFSQQGASTALVFGPTLADAEALARGLTPLG